MAWHELRSPTRRGGLWVRRGAAELRVCEIQAELQGSLRAQPAAGLSRSVGEAREVSEESHTVGVCAQLSAAALL